jgi:hypothetical protein
MGGGLMQLVAYGAQDIYLSGNPQITFFKVVYRRHTNFSVESIQQTFNGAANFGRKVTCTIARNGDLITRMYLQLTLPQLADGERWCNKVGLALVKQVDIEIGGQRIDRHYGDWMHIWNELSLPFDKKMGYNEMIGHSILGIQEDGDYSGGQGAEPTTLYIPLEFWFCRNAGLALPLISLQYHEVKVNVEFRELSEVSHWANPIENVYSLVDASLWCDYVYLDTDERRRFAQVSHEYLIEQLQVVEHSVPANSSSSRIDLTFNHPVKELVWVVQKDGMINGDGSVEYDSDPLKNLWFNYASVFEQGVYSPFPIESYEEGHWRNNCTSAKLQLNGHDRFAERKGSYFNLVQPFQHHTCVPLSKGINVYSFALSPEEHQPSGTCNFSRIDNAILTVGHSNIGNATAKVRIYAVNYNVLRIQSGMGGLAYSN